MRREFFLLANGSEMQRSSATLNETTGRQKEKDASRWLRRIWKAYQDGFILSKTTVAHHQAALEICQPAVEFLQLVVFVPVFAIPFSIFLCYHRG